MSASSSPRLVLVRNIALGAAGLLVLVLLFLWLALPRILHSQAEGFVAKTGHRLTLERPQIDPFALSLRVAGLKLDAPDGQTLLAFDELFVDLSAASLLSGRAIFDAIRLAGPAARLIELPGGETNWTPFLAALATREEAPPAEKKSALPRLEIRHFELARGALDFADRRGARDFTARVEPLDLALDDVSTLPDDSGKIRLAARTSIGAALALEGELGANPLRLSGSATLAGLRLDALAPYLAALPAPPQGELTVSARYRVGHGSDNGGAGLEAAIEGVEAKLTGLRLPLKANGPALEIAEIALRDGRFLWPQEEVGAAAIGAKGLIFAVGPGAIAPSLGALDVEDLHLNLAAREAAVGRVALAEGRVELARRADGRIDLVEAILAALPPPKEEASPPWRFRADKLELAGTRVTARDAGVTPPAELALDNLSLAIAGASDDFSAPLAVRLGFDAQGGGRFDGEGKLTPSPLTADLKLKLADLSLKPAQPYLAAKTTLKLADGKLSSAGRLSYSEKEGPLYRGEFAVRNLRLLSGDDVFLAWKSLGAADLTATARRLDIGELNVNGLDTRLIIDKDKNVNLKAVIKPAPAPTESAAPPSRPEEGYDVHIQRVRFYNGEIYFADHSLVLPFGTRIHHLRGGFGNLSSRPGRGPGQVELEGEVDDYGLARAAGQVNLFDPTAFMDLRVLFKNVEMTRLTPYTATFAGRKIDSGKLSLDLQYKIEARRLAGENQIVMDRLTLGERVESPGALDLPLDLAIALLEDADGRIDLGLPVSGSLDDPQFSYGGLVWQAIKNVLTKIVTAPFRALAALFGGGEKIEEVAFEAGAPQLTPPEREKLARLAQALAKRPTLALELAGVWAEADRVALQDRELRRALVGQMGRKAPEQGDPGPLSTAEPKVQAALESLYEARFGAADLAALKEGYRRANPGKLEESVAGKMLSRLAGLVREKKTLAAEEVERLKGADFHAVLFERLRAKVSLGDEKLKALAEERAQNAALALKAAGVAPERLRLGPPQAGEAVDGNIALKMALSAAKKPD